MMTQQCSTCGTYYTGNESFCQRCGTPRAVNPYQQPSSQPNPAQQAPYQANPAQPNPYPAYPAQPVPGQQAPYQPNSYPPPPYQPNPAQQNPYQPNPYQQAPAQAQQSQGSWLQRYYSPQRIVRRWIIYRLIGIGISIVFLLACVAYLLLAGGLAALTNH